LAVEAICRFSAIKIVNYDGRKHCFKIKLSTNMVNDNEYTNDPGFEEAVHNESKQKCLIANTMPL
jgi:hypothetical protein